MDKSFGCMHETNMDTLNDGDARRRNFSWCKGQDVRDDKGKTYATIMTPDMTGQCKSVCVWSVMKRIIKKPTRKFGDASLWNAVKKALIIPVSTVCVREVCHQNNFL